MTHYELLLLIYTSRLRPFSTAINYNWTPPLIKLKTLKVRRDNFLLGFRNFTGKFVYTQSFMSFLCPISIILKQIILTFNPIFKSLWWSSLRLKSISVSGGGGVRSCFHIVQKQIEQKVFFFFLAILKLNKYTYQQQQKTSHSSNFAVHMHKCKHLFKYVFRCCCFFFFKF